MVVPTPVSSYSTATLRYALLTGPVELAPLRVLATRCLEWRGWKVTFCVLGASHAVCLEQGKRRLTELLACASGPEAGVPVVGSDGRQTTSLSMCSEGVVCDVVLTPFLLTADAGELQESDPAQRLEIAYPPAHDMATPYTRLGWRVANETLIIETVHTYPEEGRGIRSRTVLREES